MKIPFTVSALLLALIAGCGNKDSLAGGSGGDTGGSGPMKGTEAEARALLEQFTKAGANHAALSKKLQPTRADYEAVFDADFAKKAEATYTPAWNAGQIILQPKAGQTQVLLFSATTDDLKNGRGNANRFPGGYRDVAGKFKPGLTIYAFKFTEPGKEFGMAWDGLIFVNGNWRLFPKPFRIK